MPKYDSKKLQRNFIKITLSHGCFHVKLLHIFRTPFPNNTYGGLLLIWCTMGPKYFILFQVDQCPSRSIDLPCKSIEWFLYEKAIGR